MSGYDSGDDVAYDAVYRSERRDALLEVAERFPGLDDLPSFSSLLEEEKELTVGREKGSEEAGGKVNLLSPCATLSSVYKCINCANRSWREACAVYGDGKPHSLLLDPRATQEMRAQEVGLRIAGVLKDAQKEMKPIAEVYIGVTGLKARTGVALTSDPATWNLPDAFSHWNMHRRTYCAMVVVCVVGAEDCQLQVRGGPEVFAIKSRLHDEEVRGKYLGSALLKSRAGGIAPASRAGLLYVAWSRSKK